ncbi:hypothetical protein J2T14_001114 [Paenibacillus harenae]|nr:hypothetical protein [Paenibacillus harenae]
MTTKEQRRKDWSARIADYRGIPCGRTTRSRQQQKRAVD